MYANYKYSLSSKQQQQIQLFLRMIPKQVIRAIEDVSIVGEGAFELLHGLTYAESWTETPDFEVPGENGPKAAEKAGRLAEIHAQDL